MERLVRYALFVRSVCVRTRFSACQLNAMHAIETGRMMQPNRIRNSRKNRSCSETKPQMRLQKRFIEKPQQYLKNLFLSITAAAICRNSHISTGGNHFPLDRRKNGTDAARRWKNEYCRRKWRIYKSAYPMLCSKRGQAGGPDREQMISDTRGRYGFASDHKETEYC